MQRKRRNLLFDCGITVQIVTIWAQKAAFFLYLLFNKSVETGNTARLVKFDSAQIIVEKKENVWLGNVLAWLYSSR